MMRRGQKLPSICGNRTPPQKHEFHIVHIVPMNNLLIQRGNVHNKLLTAEFVHNLLKEYGLPIDVNDISKYQLAFIHRSYLRNNKLAEEYTNDCIPLQDKCNESIEFLGDSILDAVLGIYIYNRYPEKSEGFLTKTKTKLVRGKTLSQLAMRMNLGEWLIISQHVESEDGRNNPRLLEDLFECLIAAIYLDNGGDPLQTDWITNLTEWVELNKNIHSSPEQFDRYIALSRALINNKTNGYLYCQKFIINVFERNIDIVKLISHDDNYKDQLQHYFQHAYKGIFPEWELLSVEGPTNNRYHTIGIRNDNGFLIGVGRDKKKIDAEQLASKNALVNLGVISADAPFADDTLQN